MPSPVSVLFSTLTVRVPPTVATKTSPSMETCGWRPRTWSSRVVDGPLEVVGGREDVVAVPARVQEGHLAVVGDGPAQDADVPGLLPGLEDGQQPAVDAAKLEQAGLPVVAVERVELTDERRVVQQAGYGVVGEPVQVAVVQREDVADGRLGPPAEEDVVAEEQDARRRRRCRGARSCARCAAARCRSVRSRVEPNSSVRRALSASARRASSAACAVRRSRSTSYVPVSRPVVMGSLSESRKKRSGAAVPCAAAPDRGLSDPGAAVQGCE